MEIKLATDQDVDKLIPVMIELRPHRSPAELREMIITQMKNGYQVEVKIKNYRVERGDALCNIARSFDVSCSELTDSVASSFETLSAELP